MAINTQLVLTDVYVSVPLTGIAAEDITDADATIKNIKTGAATEYNMLAGDIVLSGDTVVVHIEDTDIVTEGLYEFRLIVTNTNGDKLGILLEKDTILFK